MRAFTYATGVLLALPLSFAHEQQHRQNDDHHSETPDDTSLISPTATRNQPHLGSVDSAELLPTFDPLVPDGLRQFILEENQKHSAEHKLAERQQVAPGGGGVPPAELPTQMPTVMDFQLSGKVVHYTQTFQPTPVPWAGPKNGQIGLGTIKGQVGKPKDNGNS